MKKILLLIALCFVFVTCDYVLEYRKGKFVVQPQTYRAIQFPTNAKEIHWTVDCTPRCDFYLMTITDFDLMKAGRNDFNYYNKEEDISRYIGEFNEVVDIKKHLVIGIRNRNMAQEAQINYKLSQLVPSKGLSTAGLIAIIISAGFVLNICAIIVIIALVFIFLKRQFGGKYYGGQESLLPPHEGRGYQTGGSTSNT